jgi:hypothetical protein
LSELVKGDLNLQHNTIKKFHFHLHFQKTRTAKLRPLKKSDQKESIKRKDHAESASVAKGKGESNRTSRKLPQTPVTSDFYITQTIENRKQAVTPSTNRKGQKPQQEHRIIEP